MIKFITDALAEGKAPKKTVNDSVKQIIKDPEHSEPPLRGRDPRAPKLSGRRVARRPPLEYK